METSTFVPGQWVRILTGAAGHYATVKRVFPELKGCVEVHQISFCRPSTVKRFEAVELMDASAWRRQERKAKKAERARLATARRPA